MFRILSMIYLMKLFAKRLKQLNSRFVILRTISATIATIHDVQQSLVEGAEHRSIAADCGKIQGCNKYGKYPYRARNVFAHDIERFLLMGSFCRDNRAIKLAMNIRQNVAGILVQLP